MDGLLRDVSWLSERHRRELQRGEHAAAELAILAQRRLQETLRQSNLYRGDGPMRRVLMLTPEMSKRIRLKYKGESFSDPDFVKSLARDNPFLRVDLPPARLTVRVNGFKKSPDARTTGQEGRRPTMLREGTRESTRSANGKTHAAASTGNGMSGHETATGGRLVLS